MSWSLSSALEMEHWAKKLLKQLNDQIFFRDWISDDETNIIQRKTQLMNEPGHSIHFGLLPRLTGAGKTGDATLEGSEEDMTFYGDTVTIQQYRNAAVWPGAYWVQKVPFDVKRAMTTALRIWAQEKYDGLFFSALTDGNTHVLTIGGTLTESNFGATNELLLSDIRRLPYLAKQQRIRPIVRRGRNYYLLLLHDQASLRLIQRYSTNAQTWYHTMLQAANRDPDNPLFAGGLGMVGGGEAGAVILHEHNNANLRGTNVVTNPYEVCHSLLLGAQAGIMGIAQEPWLTEKKFDYDNKYGLATGFMMGVKKSQFNNDDYGVYKIKSWAPQIS